MTRKQASMFGTEDLPLFSGTAQRASADVFRPGAAEVQPVMPELAVAYWDLIAECVTQDGHRYTGELEIEGQTCWFVVLDDSGNPYLTQECPSYDTGLIIKRYPEGMKWEDPNA